MGGTNWSDDFYKARAADREDKGVSAFAYSDSLKSRSQSEWKANDKLSPAGLRIRESRDSKAHPTSKAVAVFFDVTGSMGGIPVVLQKKLPALMNMLIKKEFLEHPAILCGAVGDAVSDKVPLQVGQFESGIEIDEDIGRIFIEGGGGGTMSESYELAVYTAARHTSIDCYEKRREKGYLFLIGDEKPYPAVDARVVNTLFAQQGLVKDDIPMKEIVKEAQEKFHVFFLLPTGASHGRDPAVKKAWTDLLGQNVIELDNPEDVCEAIALAIGLTEGKVDLNKGASALSDVTSERSAKSVTSALTSYARSVAKPVDIKESALADIPGSGGAARL